MQESRGSLGRGPAAEPAELVELFRSACSFSPFKPNLRYCCMPSRSAWGFRGDSSDDRWWQSALFFAAVLLLLLAVQTIITSTSHPSSKHPPEMAIVLKNGNLEVHVLRIGALIQRLLVPDRDGKIDDIVLGFDTEEPYADGTSPYFGAVVGRVANRIANAHFTLNGKEYKLAANNGPNCLHGGIVGFSRVQWRVVEEESSDASLDGSASLRLAYTSPDGDEGFPGTVEAQVTFKLTKDNRLRVEMKATSDAPTPLNLAQHSYFNLGGHASGDILDHILQLEATHWTPVNDVQIPTGAVEPVEATPAMDFRSPHRVGERIKEVPGDEPKGYDHNYALFGLGPDAATHVHHGMASKE